MVMILAISAVSAADINDTSDSAIQAVDEAPIEEVASEDVDALAVTDNTDVLADVGDKNFTQLQAEIDQSTTGMVNLQSNYIRAEGESDIVINKNFNIFGNDAYTIDAKNLGGIFKINSGCSVLLNNVILTNGNGINGGAIYNEGTVNIMSSTLTANNASLGGAIYNTGIATISGSTLTENTADKGGAVYSTGTLVVDGTNFNENVATYRGGAVYNEGNFEATGSTFDGNDITFRSANDDNGGAAIYNNGGTTNLDNVKVINNIKDIVYRAGNAGDFINAAIVSTSRLYIINSYIANNSGSWGGGVYVTGNETFTVTNTVFEGNVATFGAAIYDEGTSIIVENCNFTDNRCEGVGSPGTANTQAAAILVMGSTSSAIISNSRFNRNIAKVGGAVSISRAGDVLIDDCEFVENTGYSEGGAIYNYAADGATVTVKDSTFVDNDAPFGSAISNDADLELSGNTITGASPAPIANYYGTIESELFVNILQGQTVVTILPTNEITAYITDDNGNAIIDKNLVLLVGGDEVAIVYDKTTGTHTATYTFTNPGSYEVTAKDYDAAHTTAATIIFESPLSSLQALIDANTNGTLNLTYGFSYLENHDSAIKDTGVVISKDITLNGNGVIIDGANVSRLFTVADGVTLTLNNMIITNGAAEKGAGVYVNSGAKLMADSVNFINNTAVKRGGAIYSEGNVLVGDCLFDSNDITFRTANDDNGGAAIYNLNGVLTVYRSNITNNLKNITIRSGNNGDLLVGVVVTTGDTFIIDSYFANNTGSWGGAISSLGYMNTNPYTLNVIDTTFEGNNATFGGAIFVESSNLKVDNCTFENNKGVGVGSTGTSNTHGGAIVVFPTGASANISDSTFIGNSANAGGAVSFAGVDGDTTVDNCTFINNAANDGGAVYLWTQGDATVTVENSEFEGNTAGWGSAISTEGTLKLSNNTIAGDATAIGNWDGSITSELIVTVLDAETHTFIEDVNLYAVVTDDNGNLIEDNTLKFYIDELATSYGAVYNSTSGRYERSVAITTPGTYTVTVTSDSNNLTITTGTIVVIKKGSFTDLQYQLDNLEGNTFELPYDFTYNETVDSALVNGIVLDQGISIDGKGYTISGNNQARVFNVTSNMIMLSNMTIRDGKADKGAGLYINKGEMFMAENVNFINNTATYRGGAIYTEGLVGIDGCVIDSNDITYRASNDDNGGAAIYNNGGIVYINNTAVTNNLKDIVIRDGNDGHLINAVIFNFGGAVIINNSYVANNTGSWGAGIYQNNGSVLEAYNTVFEGNNATFGSAIYNEGGMLTVDNCTFNDNAAVGIGSSGTAETQGAAILVMSEGSSATITNSKFNRNTAKLGGAVSLAGVGEDSIIDNCTFTDNVADISGGAVYLWSDTADLEIADSTFTGNSAVDGGAVYYSSHSDLTVTGSNFTNNTANYGGAIENEGYGDLAVDNSKFVENEAAVSGGAIISSGNASVTNSVFNDNEAAVANTNAIYLWNYNTLALSNNVITGSTDAQILAKGGTTIITPLKVRILDNGTYNIHMSPYTLNATVTDMDGNLIVDNAFRFVVGDTIVEGIEINATTGVYSAVFTPSETGTFVVSANLEDASEIETATLNIFRTLTDLANLVEAANSGDTIVLDGDYTYNPEFDSAIVDGIVINKVLTIDGNGSTISGNGQARIFNVTSDKFTLNNATLRDAKAEKGAAVYVGATGNLFAGTVNFINNTATYRGGAIYSEGLVDVNNCVFDSNDITFRTANADNGGAAIYNLKGTLVINNTNITNNLKDIVIRDGNNGDLLDGVVVTSGETYIKDSYFANNTGSYGGAISSLGYMNTEPYSLTVVNTKFEGNNATFGGAIFVESSKLNVENCTFENNKGVGVGSSGTSNTQGGAIVVHPSGSSATITDSTFIANSANLGGAVSLPGVDAASIIDNCTFINNTASSDGGAVYFWTNAATVTVSDSDFIGNTAPYGGAVENEGYGDLVVDGCTFVENTASLKGGAIISSGSASVTNSVFNDNEAQADTNAIYLWYPNTTLALLNNTITGDAVQIYVKAGIDVLAALNATFLCNQTVPAELGDTFTLNATLTDEKGNSIYDADFRFSVNGETIDEITFDETTGLYTVDYTIKTAGPKVISTNYNLAGLVKYIGILDIPKANVTEFTVEVRFDSIPVGENVTIYVTLLGVNGEGLNETFNVIVNNTEYPVTVANGTGSFNVSGLASGHYSALGIFPGNDNYNGAYATEIFTVLYPDPILNVTSEDITYGEDAVINITLTEADGTPLDGRVGITVGGIFSLDVTIAGFASITVPNLPANETGWAIGVFYHGDEDHLNVWNDTETVKVAKATPTVDITGPSDINIGENADFKATIDAKADVYALNIWVDGVEYIVMGPGEWDSNVAEFMITSDWLPEARDYNITVQFIGNENYTASENVSQILTVNKIDVGNVIQISGSTVTYGENATVTVELPMDAEGNVTVIIPDVGTFNATVEGGLAVVEIPGLGAGLYELFAVEYSGDNRYASHTGMATVEVKQAKSSVEIKPIAEVTYGNNVTIRYTVLNATTIKINVAYGGLVPVCYVTFDANVSKYDGSLVLSNLAAGEYFVVVENDGNDNYTFSAAPAEFTVNKAEPTMQTEIRPNIKAGDANVVVQVVLPENATGKVMLLIDGEPTNQMGYDLINGTVNITVPADFVNAGKRSYYVIYDGDDNYTSAYDLKSFEVSKADPMVIIAVIPDINNKEPDAVSIFVGNITGGLTVARATGQILIEGYGLARLEDLENGIYNLELIDIVPGDYEIKVTYLGDDNFNNATNSTKFTVPKRAATVELTNVTANILGGQNATFTVNMNPDSANGNVTIYINGTEYATVVLDDEYANATVSIPGLGKGTHTIGVKYNGNDHYNASEVVNTTVTVEKAGSKVTIDPIDNVTFGHTVEISYTVENETTVTYSVVNESGVEQTYQIKDGKLVLSGLSVGNYTVTITNAENNMFTGDSATAKFTVSENPTFDFNVNFPENSTDTVFSISVPEDAGGYLLVDIDGQHYYAPVENGTASISIPGLAPGNYTATVSYTGDGKYDNATITKEVTVPSNLPEDALTIPENGDTETPTTYSISLPADATGFLIVDVDGTKYVAALENGSASVTVPALSEGQHNVTVTYTGDDKYSSASKSTTLNVKKPVYKITNNKNVKAVYSAKAYYKVLVTKDGKAVGAGEKVTIKYNGKTYTVKTDSKGYATLKLNTKVKVKKYTITAEYKGVKVTNKVTIKHVIKAKNKKVKKSKKVTKVKITLKKVNGKVLKAKKLKVKFKGKKYTVKTNKKGVATWKVKKSMLKKLKVGKKYKYKVTYGKDVVTKKLTIKK
ncbi:Ig-like domain repeat protein [Methanobrevibacter thaueri]|uniref:Putative outer membrane protein PmpI n=1 Tax=Methanobrevibacter thaueri TaxID=190975 RepID=A0A315XKR5_9EURY|nr:Ig-like domain repeat protein [Methanobrevibacter thaueri]PWB84708.1 putative outer membrane protein PmpI precursor [Methanobrevibacter thaueri]